MIAPLFDTPSGLVAIPVGIAFGATLERAGLGRASTIADQLAGRDFTVVKVMFSAIVTAMLGIFWASRLGWLDLSRVAMPTTDIVPQVIGALLFGAGFALASLCPGTACVSAATGARDGLAAIGGLFAGTLVTSLLWSQLGRLAERAPSENATLATDLGIPAGLVVALITVVALVAIPASDRIAARFNSGAATPAGGRRRISPLAAAALALAVLAVASGTAPSPVAAVQGAGTALDANVEQVDALVLAQWIHDRKPGLRVIDVRDSLAPNDYRIPGASDVPIERISQLVVNAGETIVLYGDEGEHAGRAWTTLRAHGVRDAFVLRGGLAAWEDAILSPRVPDPADTAAVRRFESIRELSAWFGGMPSQAPAHPVTGAAAVRARRKSC